MSNINCHALPYEGGELLGCHDEAAGQCWTTAYLTPASLEHTEHAEMVLFFPAGFLRLLKSGGIAYHTLKVVSPMYDNEDLINAFL